MRTILIIGEVLFLTVLMSCLLGGLWLSVFDLGLKPKYRRAVLMALVAVGCLAVAFFAVHLISFYPATESRAFSLIFPIGFSRSQ